MFKNHEQHYHELCFVNFSCDRDCSDDFTVIDDDDRRIVTEVTSFANSWKAVDTCPEAGSEPFCAWGSGVDLEKRLLTGKKQRDRIYTVNFSYFLNPLL